MGIPTKSKEPMTLELTAAKAAPPATVQRLKSIEGLSCA